MDSSNKSFKYVPINELLNVTEEREKISSGYYIDINKHLEILGESYNQINFEQNPFSGTEHNTNEYLEYLRMRNNLPEPPEFEIPPENVAQLGTDIPIVNLDNVFENMSPEDIDALENILNNSLKTVQMEEPKFEVEKIPTKINLNCLNEMEIQFETDSDSVVSVSKFPFHNYLELGAAQSLIKLHRN